MTRPKPIIISNFDLQVGEALLILRRRKGISQSELASLASLSANTISHIERNDTNIELSSLIAAFAGLGVAIELTVDPAVLHPDPDTFIEG